MFRQLALVIGLAALLVGAAHAQQTTWDYAVLNYDGNTWSFQAPEGVIPSVSSSLLARELREFYPQPRSDGLSDLVEALDVLGGAGWELITVSTNTFYFKRQNLGD